MVKKSLIILLCLLFLFTWAFVPDASARSRGKSKLAVYIVGGIAVGCLIAFIANSVARRSSFQKETLKIQDKTNTMVEGVPLEQDSQNSIEDISLLSFKF